MMTTKAIGKYKGFELRKSEYREKRHPQYNYLGYSARYKNNYIQVKYSDLEIITIPIETLFLKFILQLDEFIFKNYHFIYGKINNDR